jgi:hypothetical protein
MFIRLPITGVLGIIFLMVGSRKRRSARRRTSSRLSESAWDEGRQVTFFASKAGLETRGLVSKFTHLVPPAIENGVGAGAPIIVSAINVDIAGHPSLPVLLPGRT